MLVFFFNFFNELTYFHLFGFSNKILGRKYDVLSEGTLLRGEEIQYEQIKNEVDEILNDDFRKRLSYS